MTLEQRLEEVSVRYLGEGCSGGGTACAKSLGLTWDLEKQTWTIQSGRTSDLG